jgi:hypothetical protein
MTVHDIVDEVVNSFVDFALYYQNNQYGVPLSTQMSRYELPVHLLASAYADVLNFATTVRQLTKTNFEPSQLGVDFYFARNGGLTGFWDKPEIYGKYANVLQELAEKYSPFIIEINE